ncbi:MAG: helix-turn-helix domain-containing protein [Nitrospirae bacterium]|nr:helix-turn-helix domain-containing protein [Nitrospirota bacterium]MBI3352293.1 helix-turn-helix domain-containing protein [Nitrospirota bacterium]
MFQIDSELMSETEAAKFLNITPRCLQNWRLRGGGPQFIRYSRRCIRYRKVDLEVWLESRVMTSTSEQLS